MISRRVGNNGNCIQLNLTEEEARLVGDCLAVSKVACSSSPDHVEASTSAVGALESAIEATYTSPNRE